MSVTISELKSRLSHYLRRVRMGETILVRDRDQVIARIEPAGASAASTQEDESWLADLERRGVVRRAPGPLPEGWLASRPQLGVDVVGALLRDREESQ